MPLQEMKMVKQTIAHSAYMQGQKEFVYGCWWLAGWYAYRRYLNPHVTKKEMEEDFNLAHDLWNHVIAGVDHVKNSLSIMESGTAIADSPTGKTLMISLSWMRLLEEELALFLSR